MKNVFNEAADHKYTVGVVTALTSRVQLEDNHGNQTTFYFDRGWPIWTMAPQGVATQFALTKIDHLLKSFNSVEHNVGAVAVVLVALALPTLSPGRVKRRTGESYFQEHLDFPITKTKYDELRKELTGLTKKNHGIYSLVFNNCTSFALNFSRSHGFDVPKVFIPAPWILRNKIQQVKTKQLQHG